MKLNYLIQIAAISTISTAVYAADTNTLEEITVSSQAEKPGIKLNKVNATSSRLGLTAKETPASVETLDIETSNKRGDIYVRDAVTRTTGMTSISSPGNGQAFSSRGFTGNNSVAQAEDGVRLLTTGTLNYPSDTWGYERIEVLRGPASVLFGDGSAGGIINSVRKQASRETSFEAIIGAGSYGAYRAGVGATGAIGHIGAFRIDASALGGNGYISRGDYDSQKLMTSLLFEPTDNLRIGFSLDHAVDSPMVNYGIPLIDGKIQHSLRKSNYNIDNNKLQFTDTRARARVEWAISPTVQLKNETYFFKSSREWRNLEKFTYNASTTLVDRSSFFNFKYDTKQYGNRIELVVTENIAEHQNRFLIGWDSMHLDFTNNGNANSNAANSSVSLTGFDPGYGYDPLRRNFESQITQNSFFMEDALNITNALKVLVGLRKDYIDTEKTGEIRPGQTNSAKEFTPLTWRAGVVFDVTPATSLYGQLSRGTDPVNNLIGLNLVNATYDLTKVRQEEVGIKHLLPSHKGEMTLAIFHITKENILTQNPNNASLSMQGGRQSSRGIELSTTLLPVDHWRVDLNATLLNACFDELVQSGVSRAGNTPLNVPEKVANAWLYYETPVWEAGIGARYVGKRYSDNANTGTLNSYTVYDASAAWNINKQVSLRANIRNMTDKFYATTAYNTQQIIGSPRLFELTAEFRY
ncbi:TonB-dependent receptor [Methylobacillus caricis]|uniref:TonB-dependent receptor n=1 Tax=Methylobacillus caricis TaxID=1971611 RepID=UPI001CFF5C4D|nr:TonB-dependent receptor [Methylobacillus caricis]MCB5188231.1 TonB-dependent receptor [Methylobacillus caricis]